MCLQGHVPLDGGARYRVAAVEGEDGAPAIALASHSLDAWKNRPLNGERR